MSSELQASAERDVRRLCAAGDYDAAATAALRAYGPEVMRFLRSSQRSEEDTVDVFSVFAEDLWRSLSTFAWECSLRTLAYVLARRASFRAFRKKRRAALPLVSSAALSALVEKVRTETASYLRTERKSRLRALRDSLPEDDQALLVLRVDRGLAWDELARVFSEQDLDEEALTREAARLRKRFQLVKEKLKALAEREGIVASRRDRRALSSPRRDGRNARR
jgi:RNA polymerase sigma-70 factor (ECF subfamily)